MKTQNPQALEPRDRMTRMREMFAKEGGILAEDYTHFTGIRQPGEAIVPNKAPRRSALPNGRPAQGRN